MYNIASNNLFKALRTLISNGNDELLFFLIAFSTLFRKNTRNTAERRDTFDDSSMLFFITLIILLILNNDYINH